MCVNVCVGVCGCLRESERKRGRERERQREKKMVRDISSDYNTLQHIAAYCNTLHHTLQLLTPANGVRTYSGRDRVSSEWN